MHVSMQRSHASWGPTRLLVPVRLGVGPPTVDPLGLGVFFGFTGMGAGRLLPNQSHNEQAERFRCTGCT